MAGDPVMAVVAGAAIAILHTCWGLRVAQKAMQQPVPACMRTIFTHMGLRLLVLLLVVAAVLLWVPLHVPVFIGVLVGGYILGLGIEVLLLQRQTRQSNG